MKLFLKIIPAAETNVSAAHEKELLVAMLYLGKLSLQIHTELIAYWKINSLAVTSGRFSRQSAKLVTAFSLPKTCTAWPSNSL